MSNDVAIAHLTGSAEVIENHLNRDTLHWRNRRTINQMFFQPYESRKEFIFCARHTLLPIAYIGFAILDPLASVITPLFLGVVALGLAMVSDIENALGNERRASFTLGIAEYIIKDLCQAIIDLILLPLTALVMCTRGISTTLQAAGIYDYDAPVIPSPAA